ncbi:MAG: type IVB secretion system protein IcmH/DotU [Nitrospirales bacterium]
MKPIEKNRSSQLVNAFFDILVLGVHARDSRDLGRMDSFRARVEQMFEEADRRGTERQYSRDTLSEARYAVVAFLDEMILQSGWEHKSQWAASPLQYHYFQTQVAGEEFFHRLNLLRRAHPVNADLLEVFQTCLVLGFEGKYKLEGREKIKDLTHDLFREIEAVRGDLPPLSPQGERSEVVFDMVKQEIPAWVILACSAAIVFFSYAGMSVLIAQETEETYTHLNELVGSSKS